VPIERKFCASEMPMKNIFLHVKESNYFQSHFDYPTREPFFCFTCIRFTCVYIDLRRIKNASNPVSYVPSVLSC